MQWMCAPPCRLYSSCICEFACIVGEGRRFRWFELDAPCPVIPWPHIPPLASATPNKVWAAWLGVVWAVAHRYELLGLAFFSPRLERHLLLRLREEV